MRTAALIVCAALAAGCQAPEPYTGPATGPRAQPAIEDELATSDRVAQALAADLQRLVDEDFGGARVVFMFGDIENNTGTVPTSEFDVIRRQIRNQLMKSGTFRDNVQVREFSARMRDISERERQGASEPNRTGGMAGGISDVAPDHVYFLNGNANRMARQRETAFYIEFTLTRESNSEIVFSQDYLARYGGR